MVLEEIETHKVVSTGTLFIEETIFDTTGNIENIVTDS